MNKENGGIIEFYLRGNLKYSRYARGFVSNCAPERSRIIHDKFC